MTDLELMSEYIAERLGIKLHHGVQAYWMASDADAKMPGIFIHPEGIGVFRPALIGVPLHHRNDNFLWEEMDEAIECFLKIKESLR